MADKRLGIYFGKEKLSIVEAQGVHITNIVSLPLTDISVPDRSQDAVNEELLPDYGEIQLVARIKASIRDNKIQAKKTCLGLVSRDQFIRGFQMLLLSKAEMDSGVLFEVKKYIPFKTEDLIFDYQQRIDRKSLKMDILFVAATKNSLDTNIATLTQAGFEIAAVEPASFALIRLLSLTKQLNPKLPFALVAIDWPYAEFSIIDKNFPCFSRDINLLPSSAAQEAVEIDEIRTLVGRLTSEIRVSLDFFRRQFLGSSISKILFLSKNTHTQEELLSGLSQDLGLPVERVELEKNKEANTLQDLDAFKAYALALKGTIKINLSVDLTKKKAFQPILVEETPKEAAPFVFNFGMLKRPVSIALILLALAYGWPLIELGKANLRLAKLRKDVEVTLLPRLKSFSPDALKNEKENYTAKINIIEKLINSRFKITPSWNVLSAVIVKGVWLESINISVKDGRQSVLLKGAVFLENEDAELEAASAFHTKLKNNPDFMRGLRKLELTSITKNQAQVDNKKYIVARFEISGS